MTATLIVLLIITLAALFFLPFSKALIKDKQELRSNPMDKKFDILVSRINQLMMNGNGEVIKLEDPRQINLFDENHANMIIRFYYSTGTLTITLKYKYFQVEFVMEKMFHDMRHAETFRQMDVANHFVEEANIAIRKHQEKVGKTMGMSSPTGDLQMSPNLPESDLMPERAMYAELTKEQRLELLNLARLVIISDGGPMSEFRNSPMLRKTLLDMQINFDTLDKHMSESESRGNFFNEKVLYRQELMILILTLMPFLGYNARDPEKRIEALYKYMSKLGYTQEEVDNEAEKMMLFAKQFGL